MQKLTGLGAYSGRHLYLLQRKDCSLNQSQREKATLEVNILSRDSQVRQALPVVVRYLKSQVRSFTLAVISVVTIFTKQEERKDAWDYRQEIRLTGLSQCNILRMDA